MLTPVHLTQMMEMRYLNLGLNIMQSIFFMLNVTIVMCCDVNV